MTKDLKPEAIDILRVIATSPSRLTPPALEKALSKNTHLKRKKIKALIKELIDRGELIYTYEFGSTFLETSFNKPIRISNSVVISPPGHQYHRKSEEIVLKIKPGAAFGDGRHPTTRLAVRGVEYILKEFGSKIFSAQHRPAVLDIGTGSGILILVAVSLGMHSGVGIDIDPCARTEAKENIIINDLTDRIIISDQYLETIDDSFYLVTANLRLPTLKKISPILRTIVSPHGFIVFSGIRSHETEDLIAKYATKGFEKLWMEIELDWAGIVLKQIK